MKHLSEEQWMDLLYNELSSEQKNALETHIKACAGCAQKRASFRQTTKELDAWTVIIPEKAKLTPQWSPVLKWAAAAAVLVTTAFATGRFSKPTLDPERIQAQIALPIQEKLSHDLNIKMQIVAENALQTAGAKLQADMIARLDKAYAEMTASKEQAALALAALREQDKTLYSALQEIQEKWEQDYLRMRQDIEKVALFSDESARNTHRQIVQLASATGSTETAEQ
jgi:hypothetical protein